MNCVQNMPWVQEIMSKLHVIKQHINKLLPLKSPKEKNTENMNYYFQMNDSEVQNIFFFLRQRGTILKI